MSINWYEFAKGASVFFWGMWLFVAAINNLVDAGTNRMLLGNMLSMKLLKEPPAMGSGLWSRAIDSTSFVKFFLFLIVVVQIFISLSLMHAGWQLASQGVNEQTLALADRALVLFGGLWGFFLVGGLAYGYWMKIPQVQQVHLSLFTLTLLTLIFIHGKF